MAQAQAGDLVRIRYSGLAADGTVFGTADGAEPLEFTVGSKQALEGLNRAVLGMSEGEKKTVGVPVEQGFGPREPQRVRQVPRSALPATVQIGDRLAAQSGDQFVPIWVRALDDQFATVDANHPLAGQNLVLQIEVVSIRPQVKSVGRPKRIHVGNLPRSFTAAALEGLFSSYGTVQSVQLINHRPTSRSQGFAFVEMDSPQSTLEAVRGLNGREVLGQTLTVSEARDPVPPGSNTGRRPAPRSRSRRGPGRP